MAEGILRDKVEKSGLKIIVDSAGTSEYHTGEAPDLRAVRTLQKKGIDISGLAARQFRVQDFDDFDQIYVMDVTNLMNVLSLARNDSDKKKVALVMDEIAPGHNRSVPDPYYGGLGGFEEVYLMLDQASEKIVERFK
jgi:protein-tyrosine phosphatase